MERNWLTLKALQEEYNAWPNKLGRNDRDMRFGQYLMAKYDCPADVWNEEYPIGVFLVLEMVLDNVQR